MESMTFIDKGNLNWFEIYLKKGMKSEMKPQDITWNV